MRVCAVDGCGRVKYARGLCARCYQVARAAGNLPEPQPDVDETVVDRLVAGERVPFNGWERREAVRRMVQRGIPKAAIARRLGVHGRQVYRDLETA